MATCMQLEAYVAQRLAEPDARAFEAHMSSCAACTAAVQRQRAIERAAKVLERNRAAAGAAGAVRAESAPAVAPPREATFPPKRSAKRWPLIASIAALCVGAAALLLRPQEEPVTEPSAPAAEAHVVAAPPPASDEARAATPPANAAAPPVAASSPTARTPSPTAPVAAPAPGGAVDPAVAATTPLPLDTDLATLEQVVASPRCGRAMEPLRARVERNDADAVAWSLLARCHSKRKRWQQAVGAYAKAMEHGEQALKESLRPKAEAARLALEKELAEPAPVADPAPTGTGP